LTIQKYDFYGNPSLDSDSLTPITFSQVLKNFVIFEKEALIDEKITSTNFEKPLVDSDSLTPKAFNQVLKNFVIFEKEALFGWEN